MAGYFWKRAGIDISGIPEMSSPQAISSLRVSLSQMKLVAGDPVSRKLEGTANAVAIPVLAVTAYGDHLPPRENVDLAEAAVEDVVLAPLAWCPHPEQMIAMHFAGDSMEPLIYPGSVIFVDTAVRDRDKLAGKLAVVSHRELGFKVARFQRVQNSDLMISANHKYGPIDVSNATKWKLFAEVLWWVSRDPDGRP